MTPLKGSAPTIWLIPEDDTGYFVFEAILRERNISAKLEPIGSMKGINQLAQQIEDLLKIAIGRRRNGDCIIVLHDTDDSVQMHRADYQYIHRICEKKRYKDFVTRLEAMQEIESWLLADGGLCKWLGRKPRPFDDKPQPSREFARILNEKHKMKWANTTKPKVLIHMDATGDKRSTSMSKAMTTFLQLPCAQEKQQG